MKQRTPLKLISLGVILLLIGFLLPFLMVIRVLQPGFALSFLSYASSLVGLILGLFGALQLKRTV